MRKLLIPLLFVALSSQGQYVFPSYGDSVSWNALECFWGNCTTEVYKYKHDTLICQNTYSVVEFKVSGRNYPIYIRSDSGKVFTRNDNWFFNLKCSEPEHTVYDFTLSLYDSIYIKAGINRQVIVDTIDFISINGITRKRMHITEYKNGTYQWFNRYWIQGLGSLTHPLYFIDPLDIGSETQWTTLCIDSNKTSLYGPNNNSCNLSWTLGINDDLKNDRLHIYPNPVEDILTISSPQEIESLRIISAIGEVALYEDVGESLDISSFRIGFYIIEVRFIDKTIIRKRIAIK